MRQDAMSIARTCIEMSDSRRGAARYDHAAYEMPILSYKSGLGGLVECAMSIRLDMPWGLTTFLGFRRTTAAEFTLQFSPPIRRLLL